MLTIGGAAIFVVVFLVVILPPITKDLGCRYGLDQFMQNCPTNELHIVRFAEGYSVVDNEKIVVDLNSGKILFSEDAGVPANGFNSWADPFMTIDPLPSVYDLQQLTQIRTLIAELKDPGDETRSYRDKVHVAFWRENHLCIYHYFARHNAALRQLAAVLKVPWLDSP